MKTSSTGYRFHRPAYHRDLEVVRGVRVQRVVEQHVHASYEIGLIEDGAVHMEVRGTPVHATGGALLVVNAGDVHAGRTDHSGGCSFALLYVTPERMRRAAAAIGMGDALPVFEPGAIRDPAAAALLTQLHAALERDAPADEVESLLQRALATILARAAAAPPVRQTHAALARVKQYIDEHYAESLGLDRLAAVAGLSKYHLVRAFGAAHGMPPHAYQNAVRIARAREALASGRSAATVARETGFADQSHFTRRFKRLVGVAPGEYARWSAGHHHRRRHRRE